MGRTRNECVRFHLGVPLGSVSSLERAKTQKPTLMGRFFIVPLEFTLSGRFRTLTSKETEYEDTILWSRDAVYRIGSYEL